MCIYIFGSSVRYIVKPKLKRNYRNRTDTETDMFGSVNHKTETGLIPKLIGVVCES